MEQYQEVDLKVLVAGLAANFFQKSKIYRKLSFEKKNMIKV
jgi:hypothetical protein